jgi:hypothetical protein
MTSVFSLLLRRRALTGKRDVDAVSVCHDIEGFGAAAPRQEGT